MGRRVPVPAVTAAPVQPDGDGIEDLLRRLDETVSIHRRWRELGEAVRERHKAYVIASCVVAAKEMEWALREMGAWDDAVDGDPEEAA